MERLPYRELRAYTLAEELADAILLALSRGQLKGPRFLREQAARAATSVSANIAEGHGRGTALDFAGFVDRGSLFELDSWLGLAARRDWLPAETHTEATRRILELNAVLYSLRSSLRERATKERHR